MFKGKPLPRTEMMMLEGSLGGALVQIIVPQKYIRERPAGASSTGGVELQLPPLREHGTPMNGVLSIKVLAAEQTDWTTIEVSPDMEERLRKALEFSRQHIREIKNADATP